MKAKTKIEKLIVELSKGLKPITKADVDYINNKIHSNYVALSYKQKHHCLECGHQWNESVLNTRKNKSVECPSCSLKLVEYANFKRGASVMDYACKIDIVKGYQVIRMFACYKYLSKTDNSTYTVKEVFQDFINDKGEVKRLSRSTTNYFSMYIDNWDLNSNLEFRANSRKEVQRSYLEPSLILPSMKTTKAIKRNGFKRGFHNINPRDLFIGLLSDTCFETLFKAKKYNFIRYSTYKGMNLKTYWQPIKISLRNNYDITDISLWKDYIDLLKYFKKDLSNAKYVCPVNLIEEHDKLMTKKQKILENERIKREAERKANAILHREKVIKNQSEDNLKYIQQKQKFFDLMFKEEDITIEPLKSVRQFYEEGQQLNHCIFTNGYYKKENFLLLSARYKGEVIETVELNLDRFNIVQARGYGNVPSEHNDKIKELINNNINLIQQVA